MRHEDTIEIIRICLRTSNSCQKTVNDVKAFVVTAVSQAQLPTAYFKHRYSSLTPRYSSAPFETGLDRKKIHEETEQNGRKNEERAGALVLWLWEEAYVPKVTSLNQGTVYWIDIFHIGRYLL